MWLATVDTAPLILQIITAFWHGTSPALDETDPYIYREIYTALREMGVASMWMGLLPIHLVEAQDLHYRINGCRRRGAKWASELVGRMLRSTLKLWLARNSLLHAKTEHGLRGHTMIELQTLVQQQFDCGVQHMEAEDHYLMQKSMEEIMDGSAECIRGWLCAVLIARGDVEEAKKESTKDRGDLSHTLPRLTVNQQQAYIDWRRVHLATVEDGI